MTGGSMLTIALFASFSIFVYNTHKLHFDLGIGVPQEFQLIHAGKEE
jgi:hypothetical protein